MQLKDFLQTVITSPSGWLCLSAADKSFNWEQFWYEWPEDQDKIIDHAHSLAQQRHVYFSAHLFSQPKSIKDNVLPTRTIQADLDEANALNFAIPPTIMVQTSPNRYQGYWVLQDNTNLEQDELERLSRKLTYAIPGADRSGWPLGHIVRLPETFNYKYDIPAPVTIISSGVKRVNVTQIDTLPDIAHDELKLGDSETEWLHSPHVDLSEKLPPQEVISALFKAGHISSKVRLQYNKETPDRSRALWGLMQECFAAGLDRDLVYWIAYNSANNKFKYPRDLRKDVLRAERNRGAKTSTLKLQIHDLRNDPNLGTVDARQDKIAELIMQELRAKGRFYHTNMGDAYYCETDSGVPGELPSDEWQVKCTIEYGLNSSTQDYRYITKEIWSFIKTIEGRTELTNLSYFDQSARTVLLHSGAKDVFVIKPDSLSVITNGASDVLFRVLPGRESFALDYKLELPRPWYEILFDSSLDYVDGIDKKQATALLAVWLLYSLLRRGFATRPLLGLIGQPGSGKSVLAEIVYMILYGHASLHKITEEDDFDIIASQYPIVFYDNVDTPRDWLADAFATSVSDSIVEKRRLYTDFGTVKIHRTAAVAITSHDPQYIRSDVADRLILINFRRRIRPDGTEDFGDETVILSTVARYRNAIWGAIVKDIQKILNTPKPDASEVPGYRIKDFASGGLWIAKALGLGELFSNGLIANKSRQSSSVLEQEALLVQMLQEWVEKNPNSDYMSASQLWNSLVGTGMSGNQGNFQKIYRNSVRLATRLFILQHALKTQFDIDFQKHPLLGSRIWRIRPKGSTT
jgi:hypothetical protein